VANLMSGPAAVHLLGSHRLVIVASVGARGQARLTNAFSKKWEHLEAAYALHFAYYNFCRVHRSLRVTPANIADFRHYPNLSLR
jgi:hypothetical protein